MQAFGQAQTLRRDGKLIAAERELVTCAQDGCPKIITDKCVPWLGEVKAALPTIVISARDLTGSDTRDVRVSVDGKIVAERIDGRPVPIDPGAHKIRCEHQGAVVERDVVIIQSQKDRLIEINFAPPPAPVPPPPPTQVAPPRPPEPQLLRPTDPPESGITTAMAVAGFSVAGAGLIVGTVTGILSLSRGSDLQSQCPGDLCSEEQRDEFDRGIALAHASTVSFVFAGVGATLGVVALVIGDPDTGAGVRIAPRVAGCSLDFRY